MDLTKNDHVDPATATTAVKTLLSTVTNTAKGIRDRAKAREAQEIADRGQYFTMRAYLKSLIPIPGYVVDMVKDKGITEYACIQLPAQSTGASTGSIISALQKVTRDPMPSGVAPEVAALRNSYIESLPEYKSGEGVSYTIDPNTGKPVYNSEQDDEVKTDATIGKVKQFLPYIFGAAVLALIIYLITILKH